MAKSNSKNKVMVTLTSQQEVDMVVSLVEKLQEMIQDGYDEHDIGEAIIPLVPMYIKPAKLAASYQILMNTLKGSKNDT